MSVFVMFKHSDLNSKTAIGQLYLLLWFSSSPSGMLTIFGRTFQIVSEY